MKFIRFEPIPLRFRSFMHLHYYCSLDLFFFAYGENVSNSLVEAKFKREESKYYGKAYSESEAG